MDNDTKSMIDNFRSPIDDAARAITLGEELKELREKHKRKAQWRHDARMALLGAIAGGAMGLLASILYDVVTKG